MNGDPQERYFVKSDLQAGLKEELAMQAFDDCCNVLNEHIAGEIKGAASALVRLEAFIPVIAL